MKRRDKSFVIKIIIPFLLVAAVALGTLVRALWNEDNAVRIKSSDIENSTLVIGTHLIHLSALNDKLYELAQASASDSGQDRVYYKSELRNGAWCDITEASSLSAIADGVEGESQPVPDATVEALFFTHHTKSDGITIDLRTKRAVNLFSIPDPYDLENLEELFPLKTQYDLYKETQKDSKQGKAKIERIRQFFETNVKNATTKQCDTNLDNLQAYYNTISGEGDAARVNMLLSVMESVDSLRRAQVFSRLETLLTEFAGELQSVSDTEGGEDEEGESGTTSDTSLQAAVNESLSNVQASLILHEGKMLSEGITIASSVRYRLSNELISHANAKNYAACEVDLTDLLNLSNIESGEILNKEAELATLNNTLMPRATERYTTALKAGESAEYRSAESSQSSSAALNIIISENTANLNSLRSELEFFTEAVTARTSSQEGIEYTSQRLTLATGWYKNVPADTFKDGADASIAEHIDFLSRLQARLQLAAGGSELDSLLAQKGALQDDYMNALDNNNLKAAKSIEEQIAELDAMIASLEEELLAKIAALQAELDALRNSGGNEDKIRSLETELSVLNAGLGENTLGDIVAELRRDSLKIISTDGDYNQLYKNIDTLGGMLEMNYKIVFAALKDIYDAMLKKRQLNQKTGLNSSIARIEELILENKAAYSAAMTGEKTPSQLETLAGTYLDSLSGVDKNGRAIIFILALKMYAEETGSENISKITRSKTQNEINVGNPYAYTKLEDTATKFLPVTAVRDFTGMRYVWNKNLTQAILARGATYYAFSAYSAKVLRSKDGGESEQMAAPAKLRVCVYIPDDYTETAFGCRAVYITGTDYGVLNCDDFQTHAEGLLAIFMK